ncbi:hypothetical protein PFISCL1PPCAC_9113, partial [Pristionchus fissidentatus]
FKKCFTTTACTGSDGRELIKISAVDANCPALLKIRAYTDKHWLVILHSLNAEVKSIRITVDDHAFLSCTNDDAKVEAKYSDTRMEIERK